MVTKIHQSRLFKINTSEKVGTQHPCGKRSPRKRPHHVNPETAPLVTEKRWPKTAGQIGTVTRQPRRNRIADQKVQATRPRRKPFQKRMSRQTAHQQHEKQGQQCFCHQWPEDCDTAERDCCSVRRHMRHSAPERPDTAQFRKKKCRQTGTRHLRNDITAQINES